MRRFQLQRLDDPSGVSGTGIVAQGIEFTDGSVVLRWISDTPSTGVWDSLADMLSKHGHGGKTRVRWMDGPWTPERTSDTASRNPADGPTRLCPDRQPRGRSDTMTDDSRQDAIDALNQYAMLVQEAARSFTAQVENAYTEALRKAYPDVTPVDSDLGPHRRPPNPWTDDRPIDMGTSGSMGEFVPDDDDDSEEPHLGLATTRQLIEELQARVQVAEISGEHWPAYKTAAPSNPPVHPMHPLNLRRGDRQYITKKSHPPGKVTVTDWEEGVVRAEGQQIPMPPETPRYFWQFPPDSPPIGQPNLEALKVKHDKSATGWAWQWKRNGAGFALAPADPPEDDVEADSAQESAARAPADPPDTLHNAGSNEDRGDVVDVLPNAIVRVSRLNVAPVWYVTLDNEDTVAIEGGPQPTSEDQVACYKDEHGFEQWGLAPRGHRR